MPIIAKHHHPDHILSKDTDYRPEQPWKSDTYVQWGARGVVLGRSPYRTAFFEAFPKHGGFIRGEGASIAEAERKAYEQFSRESSCQHSWGRRGYTNGAGICTRCKGFEGGRFAPITKLGEWRAPISSMAVETILMGWLRDHVGEKPDPASQRHDRRTWLKARSQGIDLPPLPKERASLEQYFGDAPDPYRDACHKAVHDWLRSDRCTLDEKSRARLLDYID